MSTYVSKIAGKIKFHLKEWKSITSDQAILYIVKGCKFDFVENPDQIDQRETFTNIKEAAIIDYEIDKLVQIGVIEKANHCEGEFMSTICLRPQSDGTHGMILNLKKFNKSINYIHFKMASLHSALQTITPSSFMGSLDIRHAYYLVNIDESHRKYLRFIWRKQLYEYTCLANGICSAPRWFTKLLKLVYGTLRATGYVSVYYIDDSFLQGSTFEECWENIDENN